MCVCVCVHACACKMTLLLLDKSQTPQDEATPFLAQHGGQRIKQWISLFMVVCQDNYVY